MENTFSIKTDNHSEPSNHRPPHYPFLLTQASSVVCFVSSNHRLVLIESYSNTASASQTVGTGTLLPSLTNWADEGKLWEWDCIWPNTEVITNWEKEVQTVFAQVCMPKADIMKGSLLYAIRQCDWQRMETMGKYQEEVKRGLEGIRSRDLF